MSNYPRLEKLKQTTLHDRQQQRLLETIGAILKSGIDARSPKKRPPGKAGLRAEKGYYRLLFLEGEFKDKSVSHEQADPDTPADGWEHLAEILRQLADLPELQSEILAGVESALVEIINRPPVDD